MIKATTSVIIYCPQKLVFETAADPFKQLLWDKKNMKSVTALTKGPVSKGSKFKCSIKWLGAMWYEVVEFEPYNRFAHQSKMFINRGYHNFEFISLPEGTEFIQTMQVWPRGFGFLLYPFMKMMLKKTLDSISKELKFYLENKIGDT